MAALAAERAAREAAERALAGSEGRLRDIARREQDALMRIARLSVGHADLSLEDMLGELTETASATLAVDRTSVWLLSEDRQSLCCLDLYQRPEAAHSAGVVLAAAAPSSDSSMASASPRPPRKAADTAIGGMPVFSLGCQLE